MSIGILGKFLSQIFGRLLLVLGIKAIQVYFSIKIYFSCRNR